MDIGIHFMNFDLAGGPERLRTHARDTALAAEAAGCTMFTCMDHYFQMEAFTCAEDPMLEGYTTLGYVAGLTEKMRLGLLVTGVSYRYPGLLAKIVTTLDVLSGGRAMLGIGAAWYEREHVGLGVPFYPIAERLERLEETLQICLQMWSANDGPYEGEYYRLAETLNVPPALSKPRPPILIGGGGERKLLRLVAKYADMNNLFSSSPDEVRHKLDVLALRGSRARSRRDPQHNHRTRRPGHRSRRLRRDDEGVRRPRHGTRTGLAPHRRAGPARREHDRQARAATRRTLDIGHDQVGSADPRSRARMARRAHILSLRSRSGQGTPQPSWSACTARDGQAAALPPEQVPASVCACRRNATEFMHPAAAVVPAASSVQQHSAIDIDDGAGDVPAGHQSNHDRRDVVRRTNAAGRKLACGLSQHRPSLAWIEVSPVVGVHDPGTDDVDPDRSKL
jgi:F420-dependent oxidoreductase-like protein